MKVVFMGTPDFAVPVLDAIIKAGHEVGYVITQPDKAKNRGKKVQFTPVKELAVEHGIEVLQPEKIKQSPETMELLKAYQPDIAVVVAYGQIIQKELLDLPKFGCVNVHASLLPKLRGASPIQHAILQGEEETGVTIMQMAEGLDTGDMLSKVVIPVGGMNGEQLHDKLAELGAQLLADTLPEIEAGNIVPEPQDDALHTYAGLISKKDGEIDFQKSPEVIERQIRAFDPWPGAFCSFNGETMKLWKAVCPGGSCSAEPGTIVAVSDEGIDISCGGSILRAVEIQMPGKKRVDVKAYLRGNSIEKGIILGGK
ncbi:MAG: methionyl-tRNA formyltransferase [Firmicutes bacterium]|nr:methionyl-tRNA formyltransferase [Bacillota bacterium]